MIIESEYLSLTEEDTISIAKRFAKVLDFSTIVYLEGNVGSGKTFFVRQIASKFGIDNLSSSTYSLISQYHGDINLVHCDLYRLKYISEEFVDEISETLNHPWILFVEWPLKILSIPCESSYIVNINYRSLHSRIFHFNKLI